MARLLHPEGKMSRAELESEILESLRAMIDDWPSSPSRGDGLSGRVPS